MSQQDEARPLPGTSTLELRRFGPAGAVSEADTVVSEYALTVHYNGRELATLLCTPAHLTDLGYGFLFYEGLINDGRDVTGWQLDEERGLIFIDGPQIGPGGRRDRGQRRTITTGCVSDGTFYRAVDAAQLGDLRRRVADSLARRVASATPAATPTVETVSAVVAALQRHSPLFQTTGGAHAVAAADLASGELTVVREDVGRHNAVDKVIGHFLRQGLGPTAETALVCSGRISSEMLLKTARLGIPWLISRAAPTDLAVRMARDLGVGLIGFARGQRFNLYAAPGDAQ